MKNSTVACLSLILGAFFVGCSAAPTNGVAVDSPKIPAAVTPAGKISPSIIPTAEVEAPLAPVAKVDEENSDEMVSVPDPVKKVKKHASQKIDMKARIALANQMMKEESAGSDAPVVCETKARRTPAGQLIYESSCH